MIKEGQKGKGLWKFNSSLLSNNEFFRYIKILYSNHYNFSKPGKYIQWSNMMGIFKGRNKKIFHPFFCIWSKIKKQWNEHFRNYKINNFEENFNNKESNEDYLKCKPGLNYILDQKVLR